MIYKDMLILLKLDIKKKNSQSTENRIPILSLRLLILFLLEKIKNIVADYANSAKCE